MSFLANYLAACGTSEVPRPYHAWMALSVLAAVMQDRVWMQKGATQVRPNLYVFLIGPSGIGKDEAIAHGFRLLRDFQQIPMVYGRVTAASLIDMLAHKSGMPSRYAKLFLATPELAMSVGRGPMADDLIKFMTALYGGSDVPLTERTRTSGRHVIKNHCLNWVAGTTREWLRDCVTREAVEGGFFARVACVQASYDFANRIADPALPENHEELVEGLHAHVTKLIGVEGEIVFEPRAKAIHDEWYDTRPEPLDETLIPSWRREDDAGRKIAMLLAMAEPNADRVVQVRHVVEAQRLTAGLARTLPAIIEYVGAGLESDGMRRLRGMLAAGGTVRHDVLAREMARFGMTHDRLRLYLDTLVDAGLVARDKQRQGWLYRWRRRPAMKEELDGDLS